MLCALSLFLISGLAAAANYTLWINGRTGGGAVGTTIMPAAAGAASSAW